MSLITRIARAAEGRFLQVALITEKSQLSYGELLGMVQIIDEQLSARGVRPGQTLVLDSGRAEFTLTFALLLSLRSFRVIFCNAEAVQDGGIPFDWAIGTAPMPTVAPERQIIMDPGWFAGLGQRPLPDYTGQRPASTGSFVNRTSGSTGVPKFVLCTEDSRLVRIEDRHNFHGVDMRRRRVALTHAPSNVWAILAALSILINHGSVVMLTDDQSRLPGYIDLYRVDALLTTPALLAQLIALPDAAQFLGSLRDIRSSGAMTARAVIERVAQITDARLHFGYGASEVGRIFAYVYDRDNPPPDGFLGQAYEDEIEVVLHDDDLRPLPPGPAEGIAGFRVRDPTQRQQYVRPDGIVAAEADGGDVFFPGDILRHDALGYHFVGRTSNIVNFSGEKYSLDLIAAELARAFGGRTVVPLAETDADGLERIVLVTAGDEAISPEAAQASLADRFPFAHVARSVTVPDIPLTSTGKVDRSRLQSLLSRS